MLKLELKPSNDMIRKGDSITLGLEMTNNGSRSIAIKHTSINPPYGFRLLKKQEHDQDSFWKRFSEILNHLRIKQSLIIPTFSIDYEKTSLEPDNNVRDKTILHEEVILQPNGSYTATFHLKCGGFLSFNPRPDTYEVHSNVKFAIIDNDEHISYQSEKTKINIYPSVSSVLLGCILGGFLGTLVKYSFTIDWNTTYLWNLILGSIFALIGGVAFLRKKDVQSFITVEDYLGGILVGFVAGYLGIKFIESILPVA